MCGIVAYIGSNEAAPILLDALRRLEYRGYDSAGISTVKDRQFQRRRATGKLSSLANLLVHQPIRGFVGIGHTRWATHGKATLANAHPHHGSGVAVVHNGIIENFRDIREALSKTGIEHVTETDTESVALLCQSFLAQGLEPLEATQRTVQQLTGAFAFVFLFEKQPDVLIAVRRRSPLLVGHGSNEMFVASDVIALAGQSSKVTYLEDGELALLSSNGMEIFAETGETIQRSPEPITIDPSVTGKGSHRHFMSKEIHEQPRVISESINQIELNCYRQVSDSMINAILAAKRIELVGSGTAYYACQIAGYWFDELAGIPTSCTAASEFASRNRSPSATTLGIMVSQSGETADTLAALRHLRCHQCQTLAVLNVMTSTMAREANAVIPINAGVEISVASTKAFSCQLLALVALAIQAGRILNRINEKEFLRLSAELQRLPGLLSTALSTDAHIRKIVREISSSASVLFIGRGAMFPLALEGALKVKELSYIHAEGLAGGELKHGPLALVDHNKHVIVLAPSGDLFHKTISSAEEVRARGGKILLMSDSNGIKAVGGGAWQSILLPKIDQVFAPVLYALPLQLLAYHAAVHRGTDVDQPRNLAKSVTVE